jgi:outer membrane protein OmpA-like peptidoglycan-associated protein
MTMRACKVGGILVAAALVAGGCSTKQGKGAAIGGVSGAVLGAGAGAAAKGNKGAVVGAAVGAAAGAAGGALIGRYMDKQEKELRREVSGARIIRDGDRLVVEFDSAILFDVGQSTLRPSAQHDLADFAEVLKKYPDTDLTIAGHTDSTGSRQLNERLSLERADAVVEYLTLRGVATRRMIPRGYAYDHPVASNATESGRQQNRRVEVQIAANEDLRRRDSAAEKAAAPRTTQGRKVRSAR